MTITSPPPVAPAPLATLRQHTLPALAAFALAAALVLFLAPYFPRTYLATAHFDRDEQPFQDANQPFADLSAGRPRLAQDLAAGLAATPLPPQALHASVDSPNPLLQHVTAEVRADDPVRAYVALKTALDAYAAAQRRHAREQLATARQTLQTKIDRLAGDQQSLQQQLQSFQIAHPGVLPDDPASVVTKLDRTRERLDDRQQRQKVLDEQIQRLEAYAIKAKSAPAAPTATAPAGTETPAATDPEVIQLQAQADLLASQLDEQLNALHRTEQHPYVVDLRNKLTAAQKKLESAQARAAAGKPPPAGLKAPPDNSQALLQQTIEWQLQALRSEREQVAADVTALTAQRQQLQTQVDAVLPLRRQWSGLQDQLQLAQKDLAAARDKLARFDERFPEDRTPPLVIAVQLADPPSRPASPRWDFVLVAALALGAAAALASAVAAQRLDTTFHSPAEFQALAAAPVLGAIDEIRTPAQYRRDLFVRTFLRPLAYFLFLAILAAAGWFSYTALAQGPHETTKTLRVVMP